MNQPSSKRPAPTPAAPSSPDRPSHRKFAPWPRPAALLAAAALIVASAHAAETGFRFAEQDTNSTALFDGDQPVFVYNHGVIARSGVPADRARSTYVHPLYGLDGEVLSDDFPKDHYHHRGLFWAWPHVRVDGRHYDLWMLHGVEQRFERWVEKRAEPRLAVLTANNGWYVGDRKIMDEVIQFQVHPATATARAIDVDLTLTPTTKPVTLAGAEGKSYGGLTLRFGPGTNVVITTPAGVAKADLAMTNLTWADLTLRLAGRSAPSGAAIFVHPSHPDYPPQWLLRHYGVLCLGWPGVTPAELPAGQPVHLRYRVWIHRGAATEAQIAKAYQEYLAGTRQSSPR